MGLKRVTGNSKKTQKLVDVEIASAIKSSNQTNPRSGGTTLVSGQTTMINTPAKSTESIGEMGNSTKGTSGQLTLLPYQNMTSSVRDFLARVSVLLGSEEDLKILEAHSSLRYAESLGLKELSIYYLRMSKDSSPMMGGIHSKPSSERWMNLGMMCSGRCLTARISAFHKTGKGCSLSDILEDNPDQKYFLSEKQVKGLVKGLMKGQMKSQVLELSKGEDIQEDIIQE